MVVRMHRRLAVPLGRVSRRVARVGLLAGAGLLGALALVACSPPKAGPPAAAPTPPQLPWRSERADVWDYVNARIDDHLDESVVVHAGASAFSSRRSMMALACSWLRARVA